MLMEVMIVGLIFIYEDVYQVKRKKKKNKKSLCQAERTGILSM